MEGKPMGLLNESEIDVQIENTKKLFYSSLLDKKRSIKRKWLEVGSISNEHLIATLPYRAMLNKSDEVIDERNKQVDADVDPEIPECINPIEMPEHDLEEFVVDSSPPPSLEETNKESQADDDISIHVDSSGGLYGDGNEINKTESDS